MSATETPSVHPDRVFPKGAKFPAGCVVTCPCCAERHWLALNSASWTATCPKTFEKFALMLD